MHGLDPWVRILGVVVVAVLVVSCGSTPAGTDSEVSPVFTVDDDDAGMDDEGSDDGGSSGEGGSDGTGTPGDGGSSGDAEVTVPPDPSAP